MSNLVEAWKDVKYLLGGERASKDERQSQAVVEVDGEAGRVRIRISPRDGPGMI